MNRAGSVLMAAGYITWSKGRSRGGRSSSCTGPASAPTRGTNRHFESTRRVRFPGVRDRLTWFRSIASGVSFQRNLAQAGARRAAIKRPAVVSPSMSGRFALPLVTGEPDRVARFAAVAPVGIPRRRPAWADQGPGPGCLGRA